MSGGSIGDGLAGVGEGGVQRLAGVKFRDGELPQVLLQVVGSCPPNCLLCTCSRPNANVSLFIMASR